MHKTLDFHMTTTCNHACIFCSEDDRMKEYARYPLTEIQIKTILVDRAKKGFTYVNFTGGEPTLFPKFLDLLKFTKKLGYTIYVGTNGTMLENEIFAKEFLEYVDILSISIHWYDEVTCTEQTGDLRHFDRFAKICENVSRYKKAHHYYQSNIVLNKKNSQSLSKIITNMLDTGYPLDHALVSYIAPEGIARKHYKELSMPYELVIGEVQKAKKLCDTKGINFRIFGIPLCVLSEDLQECSNDLYWKERNTIERFTNKAGKITLIDIYSQDNSRERIFVEKCHGCKWKNSPCTGVFEAYTEHYTFT